MLPTTVTLGGLNASQHLTTYPASLELNKGLPGPGSTDHTSASIPLYIGTSPRSVLGRVASATTRSRAINNNKTRITTFAVKLPVQMNEAATAIENAEDDFVVVSLQIRRPVQLTPDTMNAILGEFIGTAVDSALITAIANDDRS